MKLIGSLTSPFVRKVRIALLEKDIPFELVIDPPLEPATKVPEYNPLGKVPVLVADDGSNWYDSDLLLEYLEAFYPQKALLPADRKAALPVRQTLALADGVADAGILIFAELRREPGKRDEAWIKRQRDKVERGLNALEQLAANKNYLHYDVFGAADIAVGCTLQWLEFRLPDIAWREQHKSLASLNVRLSARSSFSTTIPVV